MISFFAASMNIHRFEVIRRFMRYDDKRTRDARRETDKFPHISYIWHLFITNCKCVYNPGEYVTMDEQLVSFRGRCPLRTYMPNKPDKYCCVQHLKLARAQLYAARHGTRSRGTLASERVSLEARLTRAAPPLFRRELVAATTVSRRESPSHHERGQRARSARREDAPGVVGYGQHPARRRAA